MAALQTERKMSVLGTDALYSCNMQHKQISKIHGWETKETCKIVCVCTIYANLNTHKTSRNVGIYKYLVKVQDQGRK